MSNGWEQKRVERFWSFVRKADGDACWEWTGTKNGNRRGYGTVALHENYKRTRVGAHKFSWMVTFGPVPEGLFVCHRCDNPGCVRPDHLFLGTAADNTHDMVAKGRHRSGFIVHGPSKLLPDVAASIVARRRQGASYSALVHEFMLSDATINRALKSAGLTKERRRNDGQEKKA